MSFVLVKNEPMPEAGFLECGELFVMGQGRQDCIYSIVYTEVDQQEAHDAFVAMVDQVDNKVIAVCIESNEQTEVAGTKIGELVVIEKTAPVRRVVQTGHSTWEFEND